MSTHLDLMADFHHSIMCECRPTIRTAYRRKTDKCIYGSNNIVHHVYCIVQFN